jgi:ATP-dependent HslUV protease subunit HslV
MRAGASATPRPANPASTIRAAESNTGPTSGGGSASAIFDYEEDAETIARKAMKIAADICVYTNENLTVETIEGAAS